MRISEMLAVVLFFSAGSVSAHTVPAGHAGTPVSIQASVPVPVRTPSAAVSSSATVSLNTATPGDLAGVPGMNRSKVRAIVAYRKKNGPFTTLDTLKKVAGFRRMSENRWQEMIRHFDLGQKG